MASLLSQLAKNPPAMQETWVQSLGWKDPLEEGMATRCSTLAWRIPWTEEPDGLQSMGLQSWTRDTAERLHWTEVASPQTQVFRRLVRSLLFCWVVLLDFLFPRGPKMAVIVLLNNSNPKLPEKNTYFHLGVFFHQPRKTFPRISSANLVSCLTGQNCIRCLLLKHSLAGGMKIATIGSD